ncbi:NAD(P)/FAD-dependent oxidoreductase [Streptantibioticus ferralitis]|uniref:FAD-dependent oxidoreductase n=1 Tax=Streptantibioticus ferralitis TaxID=236510 RepID=A0ABT5YWS9_9ACTN|nr:FAD-dependent oxidoreductase [Streptantibioticus ferralitis]MDF2256057.1 FAD-dependent oxidoreductase [Streptantibioticus ferralitis]
MSAVSNGARRRRIAVVGAGLAAARFAQQFLESGGEAELTLYGAEARPAYNRVLLADVLTGRYDPEAITLPYGEPGARLRTGTEVVAIDVRGRTLRLANGESAAYDELVLATGANPVLPPLRGLYADGELTAGAHSFRTLADCARLAEDAVRARRAVVIGGGVLGVSAARALAALGLPVEIVHQAPHLIERHLDEQAGQALRRGLLALGVDVYPGNRARALHGDGRVTGVELANGYVLAADLVVIACGARPRTGLAHSAGLAVRRGVVVDDCLATSAPGVYAIGDCAEHRGTVHGLAGPAWEQADVLAARLSGADPAARYTGSRPLARLTAGPLEYAAFGEVGEDLPGTDVLRLADATRGSYKKLVLRGDRLVGGILLGDLGTVGALTRAYERDDPLPADPLHLLITQGAAQW